MPTSQTFRRTVRWAAAVTVPLLLAPMGVAASEEVADYVPVRNSNGWAKFNDLTTMYVDPQVEPGLAQMSDGRLVVAWRQGETAIGNIALYTTTVAPDGTVDTPVAQVPGPVNPDPEVLARPGGAEVIYIGSSEQYTGTNAYRLLVDRTGQVTGPGEGWYFAGGGVDMPLNTAVTADGETVVNQFRRYHVGLAAPTETEDPEYLAAWWPMSHLNIAAAGNTTYLAHALSRDITAEPGSAERGIYVGPVDAAQDELPQRLPDSWYVDKAVALEGSTTGALWAAYCIGADACDRLLLHDVLGERTLTVPTGEYASQISLSPAPGGRMWVVWQSGTSAVSAVRTNKAVTRFGPVRRSAPFYTSNSLRSVVVDGRTGPADIVVNGRMEVWHRRYLVPLTVKATPATWAVGRKQTVAFVVKDAGDSVPQAKVTLAGKSCTTDTAGTCSIGVPARSKPATLVAKISKEGYELVRRTFRVG